MLRAADRGKAACQEDAKYRAETLFVEAGPAFLLFEGVLDPARIGEGHAVKLVDTTRIGLYRQGDVDEALDADHGDVAQADALDVLGLPARPQLDPVLVDADDSVIVASGLRYRSFQAVLRAACGPSLTPGYKTALPIWDRHEKTPAGGDPAGANVCLLCGTFGYTFQRIGDPLAAVAVLVIGRDEVRVAKDSVLVDVEAIELLLGLDPNADGSLERREDGERGQEDESPCCDDAESLNTELVEAAAVEQARLADSGEGRGGEQTAGECAPDTAHTVCRYGAERIVDPDLIHVDEGGVHYDAGDEAYHDRDPGRDECAGRGDSDEGRNGAVAAHTDVHVAPVQVAHAHRAEDSGGGGQVRRQGDVGDVRNGRHRRSWVEAPPADPEYEDTEDGERHVVTRDVYGAAVIVVLPETRTEEQSTGERRHRTREVDDRRACEVLHAELGQPATAPDPVSHHRVDQTREDEGEDHVDRELGPLQHRAPHNGQ